MPGGSTDSKRIVILSSHAYLPTARKASVHFVAENWAAMGHRIHFATVGYSWLSAFKRSHRFHALRKQQNNRFTRYRENLHAGCYLPLIHGFSSSNALLRELGHQLMRRYGRHLPGFVVEKIREADLVVIESGTPLAFVELVRRVNPSARMLYFCRDLLSSVGASDVLRDIERRHVGTFDAICVPSRRLGTLLPPGGKVVYVPQGVDGTAFDAADVSPYPAGSRNAVVAGDMLFDQSVILALSQAAPEVTFHLFGVRWNGAAPGNVRLHGEQGFEVLAPYIRHADFGIAPYCYSDGNAYLAESSLKLLQYSYCGLPIILPDTIATTRGNEVYYRASGESDWRGVIERALAVRHPFGGSEEIPSWRTVAERTLVSVFP